MTTCLFFRGGDPKLELYLLCFDLGWWYDIAHELEIRKAILEKSGIRDDQLVTHMGHTHAGPASNLQNLDREGGHLIPPYREKIVEGAVAAHQRRKANAQPAVAVLGARAAAIWRATAIWCWTARPSFAASIPTVPPTTRCWWAASPTRRARSSPPW